MNKLMRAFLLVPALLLFASAGSAEEIYKWVDKDGNVHYGDRPKGAQADRVTVDRPGFDPEPVTEEQAAAAAARKKACEEQTAKYERYKAADVIKQTDAFGETREFTPEERAKFLALTKSEMEAACSAPPPAPPAAEAPNEEADVDGDADLVPDREFPPDPDLVPDAAPGEPEGS